MNERIDGTLTIGTDHRFIRYDGAIYDTYCFDRQFFSQYRRHFCDVQVLARIENVLVLPEGARPVEGDGVTIIPIARQRHLPVHQRQSRRKIAEAVQGSHAVCARLPSRIGSALLTAAARSNRPAMFELIGDPRESLRSALPWPLGPAGSRIAGWQLRREVRHLSIGSYVSRQHLQEAYPASPGAYTEAISSIRLLPDWMKYPRKLSGPPETLRLVLVASLIPVKNHKTLLRAAAEAARKRSLAVHLVGDGPLRRELEDLSDHLGIRSLVHFHGHVSSRNVLAKLLDESDVFTMTSYTEGLPRAMIEAMARGVPAIGTAVGGIRELLPPAALVPPGDHVALAQTLLDLDASRLNELSRLAYATALEYGDNLLTSRRDQLLFRLRIASRQQ